MLGKKCNCIPGNNAACIVSIDLTLTFALGRPTVSGLWGILYFKEVTGTVTITKWFLSALFTVAGILLLSYEHHVT